MYLPLANVLHHKLRSVLSAFGIGIGVCMLIALSGLARGSLYEVARRWEAVDADLLVFPRGWGHNAVTKSGVGLSDRYVQKILQDHADIVQRIVPVFTWSMQLGGQEQMAAGVDADQWTTLAGGRELLKGRLFDPQGKFAQWLQQRLQSHAGEDEAVEIEPSELAARGGLELVIDSKLARAARLGVGDTVMAVNHKWTIVGVAPEGVMTRVFMPRRTAQYLFGSGSIQTSTMLFVKLKPGVSLGPAARAIEGSTKQDVIPVQAYRGLLIERFGVMFKYVDMVNGFTLVIAFLFIMTTLYTMVLQRTREIAILKSCGASNAFIVRQVLAESAILTGAGTAVGVGLAYLTAWLVPTISPLLTVEITWQWIAIAALAALAGAMLSGLYPAWRATRVDMVEALTLE